MRVTTMTSLAVFALLCPWQCAAQGSPPNKAAAEATKTAKPADGNGVKAKIGKGRVGSLSPDEAKRAARARERAAAALKPKTSPATKPAEVASKPPAKPEQKPEQLAAKPVPAKPETAKPAPTKQVVKTEEIRKDAEAKNAPKPDAKPETPAVKTVETQPAKDTGAQAVAVKTSPDSKTTASADHADPQVGRSVSVTRVSRHAVHTAEAKRRRLAARAERRRIREAEDAPRVRYGDDDRRSVVVVESTRPVFEGRSLFAPRPMWRVVPQTAYAYPPYPRSYGYGYDD